VNPTLRLGALAWVLAVQFFVAQLVVTSAWTAPFSLRTRTISDLGNTACGPSHRPRSAGACSPRHAVMNASFVIVGVTMAVGALLTRHAFAPGAAGTIAAALFVAAGVGVILVGRYPENENATNHLIGAALNFVAGNAALILFGVAVPKSPRRRWLSPLSVVAGLAGLIATGLIALHLDLGMGEGGIERVAAYTTASWQIVAGVAIGRRARA